VKAPQDAGDVAQMLGYEPGPWHLVSLTVDGGHQRGTATALCQYGDPDGDDGLWAVLFGGVWCNPHDTFSPAQLADWWREARPQCIRQQREDADNAAADRAADMAEAFA
jgi:hypothetical protein